MKVFLAAASGMASYTARMPLVEIMEEMGPVMDSTVFLNASSSDMPLRV